LVRTLPPPYEEEPGEEHTCDDSAGCPGGDGGHGVPFSSRSVSEDCP
jgi:hypothetical protein